MSSSAGTAKQPTSVPLPFPRPAVLTLAAAGDMGSSGGGMNATRAALLQQLGVHKLVMVRQEHTRDVLVLEDFPGPVAVEAPTKTATPRSNTAELTVLGTADGVICNGTGNEGLWLGVTVADCVPILVSAGSGGPCAVLHSGRKGTGIVLAALEMMRTRYGVHPAELDVLIGPAIGACCYQVGEECAADFGAEWGEQVVQRRSDGPYLDLPHLNQELALGYGVTRVRVVERCTRCDTELGSYRREGPDNYTRMLALLQVRNNTL